MKDCLVDALASLAFVKREGFRPWQASIVAAEVIEDHRRQGQLANLLTLVCNKLKVEELVVCSKCRTPTIVEARNLFVFLARDLIDAGYSEIAELLGVGSGTVRHAPRECAKLLSYDARLKKAWNELRAEWRAVS